MNVVCPHCHKVIFEIDQGGAAVAKAAQSSGYHTDGTWTCPIHQRGKIVPAGVSKRTGKPYNAFWACSEAGCNEKAIYSGPPPQTPPPAPVMPEPPPDELIPF